MYYVRTTYLGRINQFRLTPPPLTMSEHKPVELMTNAECCIIFSCSADTEPLVYVCTPDCSHFPNPPALLPFSSLLISLAKCGNHGHSSTIFSVYYSNLAVL